MGRKYQVIKRTGSTCILRKADKGHGNIAVPIADIPGLCELGEVLDYHER